MRTRCGGVLLAAGAGRRLGGPKALVTVCGERLVERGVRLLTEGGCAPVVVVLGAGADEVRSRCTLGEARIVVNERWPSGMASSLHAGIGALHDHAVGAVVVALVDQPLVGAEAVRRLGAAWRAGGEVVVAGYDGAPRNPVLIDRAWWPEVLAEATGDRGARDFLRARPQLVHVVDCSDTGSPDDLDTPADLTALGGRLDEKGPLPCS